jgi:3-deoxy-manno-octulosonate cytidylyltransferase (CMP-KDO synthetase)
LKVIGIIPARYASTRFPGKPLAKIGNKTMIEWTYFHSKKAKSLNQIIVATDHPEIFQCVKNFGGEVILTSPDHATGTDRIIEATNNFPDCEIIVNIQGDEPGIESELIDGVVNLKLQNRNFEMTTAACILEKENYTDPNRVKVVFDKNFRAVYFSRSQIPSNFKAEKKVYKHIGIYCYEKKFLLEYNSLPKSELEDSESLEQLRAIENGNSIGVHIHSGSGLSVDTESDLNIVISDFKKRGLI